MTAEFSDERLSAYLDGELTPAERDEIDALLSASAEHRQLVDELRALSQTLQDLPRCPLGDDFAERVLHRAVQSATGAMDVGAAAIDVGTNPFVAGNGAGGNGADLAARYSHELRRWRRAFWSIATVAAGLLAVLVASNAYWMNDAVARGSGLGLALSDRRSMTPTDAATISPVAEVAPDSPTYTAGPNRNDESLSMKRMPSQPDDERVQKDWRAATELRREVYRDAIATNPKPETAAKDVDGRSVDAKQWSDREKLSEGEGASRFSFGATKGVASPNTQPAGASSGVERPSAGGVPGQGLPGGGGGMGGGLGGGAASSRGRGAAGGLPALSLKSASAELPTPEPATSAAPTALDSPTLSSEKRAADRSDPAKASVRYKERIVQKLYELGRQMLANVTFAAQNSDGHTPIQMPQFVSVVLPKPATVQDVVLVLAKHLQLGKVTSNGMPRARDKQESVVTEAVDGELANRASGALPVQVYFVRGSQKQIDDAIGELQKERKATAEWFLQTVDNNPEPVPAVNFFASPAETNYRRNTVLPLQNFTQQEIRDVRSNNQRLQADTPHLSRLEKSQSSPDQAKPANQLGQLKAATETLRSEPSGQARTLGRDSSQPAGTDAEVGTAEAEIIDVYFFIQQPQRIEPAAASQK